MNKKKLVKTIVAELVERVALHVSAADAARAEATAEESKPEDQYDTRGLEASFLAAGQSRQMAEAQHAIADFESMTVGTFGSEDPIDVGALVEVRMKGEPSAFYFIGPSAGGTEVTHEKRSVVVLTPQSPLGQQLVGRRQGDRLKVRIGGRQNEYRVIAVH